KPHFSEFQGSNFPSPATLPPSMSQLIGGPTPSRQSTILKNFDFRRACFRPSVDKLQASFARAAEIRRISQFCNINRVLG
ncbi:MAG: hypothetical protein ACK4NV_14045, partial [Pannonibacter sp.]